MMTFARLPNFIVNLEQIQLLRFEPDPALAVIAWVNGIEETTLEGVDALALVTALEQHCNLINVSDIFLPSEELA